MENSINLKKVFNVLIQVLVKFRIEVGFQCIISAELDYNRPYSYKNRGVLLIVLVAM